MTRLRSFRPCFVKTMHDEYFRFPSVARCFIIIILISTSNSDSVLAAGTVAVRQWDSHLLSGVYVVENYALYGAVCCYIRLWYRNPRYIEHKQMVSSRFLISLWLPRSNYLASSRQNISITWRISTLGIFPLIEENQPSGKLLCENFDHILRLDWPQDCSPGIKRAG